MRGTSTLPLLSRPRSIPSDLDRLASGYERCHGEFLSVDDVRPSVIGIPHYLKCISTPLRPPPPFPVPHRPFHFRCARVACGPFLMLASLLLGQSVDLLLHELAFRSGSHIVCWSVTELELFLFCFVGFVGFSCGRRDCIDSAVLPRAVCAVHWSSVWCKELTRGQKKM